MSYTVADWIREHAEVQIRLPDGQGGYTVEWVPVDLGDVLDYDRLARVADRTWPGDELRDFRAVLAEYRQQEGERR